LLLLVLLFVIPEGDLLLLLSLRWSRASAPHLNARREAATTLPKAGAKGEAEATYLSLLLLQVLVLQPKTIFRDFHKFLQKTQHPKTDISRTTLSTQSTTTCPQKHHT